MILPPHLLHMAGRLVVRTLIRKGLEAGIEAAARRVPVQGPRTGARRDAGATDRGAAPPGGRPADRD